MAVATGVVLVALGVKAAVVPVHSWLPVTYPAASPAVTAIFSGLLTKIGEPVSVDGRQITTSASIGVVVADWSMSAEAVLRNADVAMYEAKAKGKSRFVRFERETDYIALQGTEGYSHGSGFITSSKGGRWPVERYREVVNEFQIGHSTAKHARHNRQSYMVGALSGEGVRAVEAPRGTLYHHYVVSNIV